MFPCRAETRNVRIFIYQKAPVKGESNLVLIWPEKYYYYNKCHTWPFIDLNISSFFILIKFLLCLSTFSKLKLSCHHIAAAAKM